MTRLTVRRVSRDRSEGHKTAPSGTPERGVVTFGVTFRVTLERVRPGVINFRINFAASSTFASEIEAVVMLPSLADSRGALTYLARCRTALLLQIMHLANRTPVNVR